MKTYYVHTRKDAEGDYEVHAYGCDKMPESENRVYLGLFSNCENAVVEAKKYRNPVNGCIHCCTTCHTR